MNAKAKGSRVEREVKKIFEAAGFEVVRSAGSFGKADLFVKNLGSVQVKARKNFSVLSLFEEADLLVIKPDRKEPYAVIKLSDLLKLLAR